MKTIILSVVGICIWGCPNNMVANNNLNDSNEVNPTLLHCSVSQFGHDRQSLSVDNTSQGSVTSYTEYKEHQIGAAFVPGSQYEPQQLVIIEIDDFVSQVYNPSYTSLYKLTLKSGVEAQCWFE